MPVIEGADLTSVSTTREPLPEEDYLFDIIGSEMSEDKNKLILKLRVVEPEEVNGVNVKGREFWEWLTVKGEWGHIGLQQLKRYLEAVFGKGSTEADTPDSDPLHGQQVRAYLIIDPYKDKTTGEEVKNNKAKRIRAA